MRKKRHFSANHEHHIQEVLLEVSGLEDIGVDDVVEVHGGLVAPDLQRPFLGSHGGGVRCEWG